MSAPAERNKSAADAAGVRSPAPAESAIGAKKKRTFSEWKVWCAVKLLEIRAKYEGNEKIGRDVEALLVKLQYLRLDALPSFLVLLHAASVDAPDFLSLIPSSEEVEEWFEGEEE